jgi:hypothetical protein
MFVQEPLDVGYVRRRVLFILETISWPVKHLDNDHK